MDEVIKAIDQMAYEMSTSRSNLVNQILAEKVMLITPEMRMKNIFEKIISAMETYQQFQVQLQPSDYCIAIRSPLNYKYNPTIRYFVELYRKGGTTIGELKITSRTQSRQLQQYLLQFFRFFKKLEQVYISKYFPERSLPDTIIGNNGRFEKKLILVKNNPNITTDAIAKAIGEYIQLIDRLITIYFTHLYEIEYALNEIERQYALFWRTEPILL